MQEKKRSKLRWYLKMLYEFIRISFRNQIEYKLNFAAGFFVEMAYMLIKLSYLIVVLNTGVNIGPLTPNMIGLFVGVYMFMTGIWMMFTGVYMLPHKVISGDLDMLITKPGSLQFMQTMGQFDFAMPIPNVAAGICVIVWSWKSVGVAANCINIAGFVFYMLMGIFLTYGFVLLPSLLVFWVSSVGSIGTLFAALWDFNNMPMMMYTKTIKAIGTFIIPIFVITNWSGAMVLNLLSPLQLIWGAVVPGLVFVLSRLFWKKSLSRYISANG